MCTRFETRFYLAVGGSCAAWLQLLLYRPQLVLTLVAEAQCWASVVQKGRCSSNNQWIAEPLAMASELERLFLSMEKLGWCGRCLTAREPDVKASFLCACVMGRVCARTTKKHKTLNNGIVRLQPTWLCLSSYICPFLLCLHLYLIPHHHQLCASLATSLMHSDVATVTIMLPGAIEINWSEILNFNESNNIEKPHYW